MTRPRSYTPSRFTALTIHRCMVPSVVFAFFPFFFFFCGTHGWVMTYDIYMKQNVGWQDNNAGLFCTICMTAERGVGAGFMIGSHVSNVSLASFFSPTL